MDPDVTWQMLCEAEMHHDRGLVAQAADALVGWLERGGFMPRRLEETYGTRKAALGMLRMVRSVAEML